MNVVPLQEPLPDEIRAQLERMARSETFRYSLRMCRLLRFVVEHALDPRSGPLKEYLIGLRAFDRPESFDPRTDPIVRVEASRLRAKLRDYYSREGAGDAVLILLPKRGYLPEFGRNHRRAGQGARTESGPGLVRPVEPTGDAPPTVAVLPFLDLSPGQTEEYFCDGMAEELINLLARVDGLRAVPRTTVFQLKGAAFDIAEIASRLRANAIVEGSLRRAGDTVRISVQVLDPTTGYHLWAETYERQVEDVLAVQLEIAHAIAAALRGTLTEPSAGRSAVGKWEAYHHYLRGLHAWNRRTGDGFSAAAEHFRRAIAEEPEYAQAWARLAQSHAGLLLSSDADPRKVLPEAGAAAERALSLSAELPEALMARAFVAAVGEHDWAQAEKRFVQAIAGAPSEPSGHEWFALVALIPQGRLREAITHLQLAVELDPASAVTHYHLGLALHFDARPEEARQQLLLAVELEPRFYRAWWDLAMVHAGESSWEQALACFDRARQTNQEPTFRLGSLGHAYATMGKQAEARAVLAELREAARERYISPVCQAMVHIGLGEHTEAVSCLEVAAAHGSHWVLWLRANPVFAPLNKHAGFEKICSKLGLIDCVMVQPPPPSSSERP